MLKTIILSKDSSFETRACAQGAMLFDNPINVMKINYDDLEKVQDILKEDSCLPVGSVEFISQCLKLSGKEIPENISYPKELQKYLKRNMVSMNVSDFLKNRYEHIFVKPQKTKLFTGFCFKISNIYQNEDHAYYHQELLSLNPQEMLWVSPVVEIDQEWRCYVQNRTLIGYARYDQNENEDTLNLDLVHEMIKECSIDHPYTIDLGAYKSDNFLMECNDAWAIGFYYGAMKPKDYLLYLWERWKTI